jgi:hypothetical protein
MIHSPLIRGLGGFNNRGNEFLNNSDLIKYERYPYQWIRKIPPSPFRKGEKRKLRSFNIGVVI